MATRIRRAAVPRTRHDLLELPRVIQVVQPHEQERFSPVEGPEHPVLDGRMQTSLGVGAQDAREERGPIALEDRPPLAGRVRPRLRVAGTRAGRTIVEDAHDPVAEVAPRRHHVRHDLVRAPLLGLRTLLEPRAGHGLGRRAQLRHGGTHGLDHVRG
jgi:hypothetical protein